jgi:hypothetical protein
MGASLFDIMAIGPGTVRTSTPRNVFWQRGTDTYLGGGLTISGQCSRDTSNTANTSVLQAGLLMGRITTVVNSLGTIGYYANSVIGSLNGAILAGATSITVAAAVVTELVRRCGTTGTFTLTGPPTANGVVSSETVTYSAASGTTITCTATANAYVTGSLIGPTDGSQVPMTFIDDLTLGLNVVDTTGANVAAVDFTRPPITGVVDRNQFLPVAPTDTSLIAWIFARLNDSGGNQYIDSRRMTG